MLSWFQARYSRPLVVALVAATLTALFAVGGLLWVQQQRALELRLAFAQAETSRLAGLLDTVLARVDQAVIGLALIEGMAARADCGAQLDRVARTMPGAVTSFTLIEAGGGVACASSVRLRFAAQDLAAPPLSIIGTDNPAAERIILLQRPGPDRRRVVAELRVEALRLAAATTLAAVLEDSRGTRIALSDGRATANAPSAYFPPAAGAVAVSLPTGRRIVARIGDHLAVTLDLEGATPADARAAALIATGWVFLALAVGLAAVLLVARLTLLRPLRHRLGETA